MTPFEYLAGGLGTLFESCESCSVTLKYTADGCNTVGAFIGLILLAIALIVVGGALLIGVDHVKSLLGRRTSRAGHAASTTTAASTNTAGVDAPISKEKLRPYRVAKEKGVPRDDRLNGLILVICGLGLLWLIPAYLLKDKNQSTYQPPIPPPTYSDKPSYSRKFSLADSTPGQAVLGVMTLVVLLATFALLGPEKQTKKATEKVQNTRTTH